MINIIIFVIGWIILISLFSQSWYWELVGAIASIFAIVGVFALIGKNYFSKKEYEKIDKIKSYIESGDYKTAYIMMKSMAIDNPYSYGGYSLILQLQKLSKLGYEPAQLDVCKYYLYDDSERDKAISILEEISNKGNKEADKILLNHYKSYDYDFRDDKKAEYYEQKIKQA